MARPPLTVVDPTATTVPPPNTLGQAGQSLWRRILGEFTIEDAAGKQVLYEACALTDRAEGLRQEIDLDGPVLRSRSGLKSHPSIKDEISCRTAVTRILARLGVLDEPTWPSPGRPPQGWRG
jgi:hypothetical protein